MTSRKKKGACQVGTSATPGYMLATCSCGWTHREKGPVGRDGFDRIRRCASAVSKHLGTESNFGKNAFPNAKKRR